LTIITDIAYLFGWRPEISSVLEWEIAMDEIAEALTDLREEIARLPRWNDDHTGMHQDNQRGRYLLRDDVLGVFALYLGPTPE
jgi:hypothetical protein